jgi:hypothetical protein
MELDIRKEDFENNEQGLNGLRFTGGVITVWQTLELVSLNCKISKIFAVMIRQYI